MKNNNILINWVITIVTGSSILVGLILSKPLYVLYGIMIITVHTRHLLTMQKIINVTKSNINKEAFLNSIKSKYKKLLNNDQSLVEQGFIDGAKHVIDKLND